MSRAFVWNSLVFLAALAVAAPACGNKNDKPVPTPQGQDGDGAQPSENAGQMPENGTQAKGTPSMAGNDADIALIKEHYASELKLGKDDIKVRVLGDAKVPGITVFTAAANPRRAGRNVSRTGIVAGGAIYTEADAMTRVAKAWAYGAQRTVSAVDFARVMGRLHNSTHEVAPILDSDTLDVFQSTAYPKQAAAAALPRETTVDGLPAVEYCITSGARTIPFTVVTAIVKPDFQVELKTRPIMNE